MTPGDLFGEPLATPKPKTPRIEGRAESLRQRVLFSGLDCKPGQKDLFPTDGTLPQETTGEAIPSEGGSGDLLD